jgi:hypothetical protein
MSKLFKSFMIVLMVVFSSNCLADANDVNDVIIQQGNVDATYGIGYFKTLIVDSNVLYTNPVNGYVGIGTTSPAAKLDVNGNIICSTPTANNHAATKAYVDDQINAKVGSGTMSPLSYTGVESSTFPNGMIIKCGYKVTTATSDTVTFGTPFPGGITSVVITDRGSVGHFESCIITGQNVNGFSWTTYAMTDKTGFNWIAIGY